MANYKIIVLPTEECNPEYAPDKVLQEGVEADGFAIVTKKHEEPDMEVLMDMSVDAVRKWMRQETEVGNIFRAAAGLADAEIRTGELLKVNEKKMNAISELLSKMFTEDAGHGD